MKLRWPSDEVLRWINRVLLLVVIGCNAYVLIAPLWPQLTFAVQTKVTKPIKINPRDDASLTSVDRSYNHILIPKLQLDERIYDGAQDYLVHSGVWRRPQTAQPGQGSNTVMVGHRFTYNGPSVFYHLNRVKPGDEILVVWDHKLYIYRAFDKRNVEPTAVSIESPTDEERLTLYTCDPLWSLKYRLVVSASLEKVLP